MTALSEHKLAIVRTLVASAPDRVLDGLESALASAGREPAMVSVRGLVADEARDRRLCKAVFLPIIPLCAGETCDPDRLEFPARVAGLIWRGLKSRAPELVRAGELALDGYRLGVASPEPFDRLARRAAEGLRAREGAEFMAAAELCDQTRPAGDETMAACLDLVPMVRSVAHKLPDCAAHPASESVYGVRLAYQDAVAIAPDAGPLFFQMLAAQLPLQAQILRIIGAVMERPTERYLAETELGIFGVRVLAEIETALQALQRFDLDGGTVAAVAAARLVDEIVAKAHELEASVVLSRDQNWGRSLAKHRKALANLVESRLRECEDYFQQALPSGGRTRLKRARRHLPRVTIVPDQAAVRGCDTLLVFVLEVRHSASEGGFASARGKLLESLVGQLDVYVETLLELVRTGQAENAEIARAFLGVAADFTALLEDAKAAELVRRRTVAAFAAAAQSTAEHELELRRAVGG
jgi:hypothetical protein